MILYKWAQWTPLCSHLTKPPFPKCVLTLLPPPTSSATKSQPPKGEVSAAAQNIWLITSGLPFQEIPQCVLSLCPQLAKKGERRTNQYKHPSCDLAHKEIKKINPLHNLYNLTLGRKQHLGWTPNGTVFVAWCLCFLHWMLSLVTRELGSSPVQLRQCLSHARANLSQKGGEWREGNVYALPVSAWQRLPLTLQRQGKLEPPPKDGSWTNYCLANQSKSRMKANVI